MVESVLRSRKEIVMMTIMKNFWDVVDEIFGAEQVEYLFDFLGRPSNLVITMMVSLAIMIIATLWAERRRRVDV